MPFKPHCPVCTGPVMYTRRPECWSCATCERAYGEAVHADRDPPIYTGTFGRSEYERQRAQATVRPRA
ncbi:hypothetical protein [Burkholderia pseudomallei]|uniref:hypothetical protein n=1 Tax=Burkholderia pseudomallei TaxID=28450 RepID=UPI000F121675|nr:hypothetical protein [Burkholderia pseudomallei]VBG63449.1 Uncharacterised protein [Burkholderia pseudomallei]